MCIHNTKRESFNILTLVKKADLQTLKGVFEIVVGADLNSINCFGTNACFISFLGIHIANLNCRWPKTSVHFKTIFFPLFYLPAGKREGSSFGGDDSKVRYPPSRSS